MVATADRRADRHKETPLQTLDRAAGHSLPPASQLADDNEASTDEPRPTGYLAGNNNGIKEDSNFRPQDFGCWHRTQIQQNFRLC